MLGSYDLGRCDGWEDVREVGWMLGRCDGWEDVRR